MPNPANAGRTAGEVTLTGKVLPSGGVKEKTLAARRSGVKHILFPEGNRRDWEELTDVSVVGWWLVAEGSNGGCV